MSVTQRASHWTFYDCPLTHTRRILRTRQAKLTFYGGMTENAIVSWNFKANLKNSIPRAVSLCTTLRTWIPIECQMPEMIRQCFVEYLKASLVSSETRSKFNIRLFRDQQLWRHASRNYVRLIQPPAPSSALTYNATFRYSGVRCLLQWYRRYERILPANPFTINGSFRLSFDQIDCIRETNWQVKIKTQYWGLASVFHQLLVSVENGCQTTSIWTKHIRKGESIYGLRGKSIALLYFYILYLPDRESAEYHHTMKLWRKGRQRIQQLQRKSCGPL